jgi:hypothetical protein
LKIWLIAELDGLRLSLKNALGGKKPEAAGKAQPGMRQEDVPQSAASAESR